MHLRCPTVTNQKSIAPASNSLHAHFACASLVPRVLICQQLRVKAEVRCHRRVVLTLFVFVLACSATRTSVAAVARGSITLSPTTVRIVASERNRALAKSLAQEIADAARVRVPVIIDNEVEESTWRDYDLILIGNLNDNRAVARLYDDYKAFLDAAFPGEGGLMVKTLADPLALGTSVVLVGGSDPAGTKAAVARFVSLVSSHGASLPALHAVVSPYLPETAPSAGQIEEILEQNRRNFEVGAGAASLTSMISYGLNFHFTARPVWAQLFKGTLLDYITIARREGHWDFDPLIAAYFQLSSMINVWDLIEDDYEFTTNERETITEALLDMAGYVSRLSYAAPLAYLPGEPRQNHSTYVGLSLEGAVRYFGRRGYGEVSRWREITERLFDGQVRTYRADDDAAGYCWYAPMHTFSYYQRRGSSRARRKGFLDQLADLAIILTDNRRDEATFGDIRTYTPWEKVGWPATATVLARAVWVHGDAGHQWAYQWLTEGKRPPLGLISRVSDPGAALTRESGEHAPFFMGQLYGSDSPAADPTRLLGISAMLLDAPPLRWVASRVMKPSWMPRSGTDYLDKLSMRSSFQPVDEYLLLDGTATFAHGHKDANAILRLTWQDRIWLANLDYTRRQPRHTNSIDVARDGQTGVLPPLAELAVRADLGRVGFVRSDLVDYNGMDWSRNLLWAKGRYFVVIDQLQAREPGDYDLRCYWRLLGDAQLEDRTLEVTQPGAHFYVANADVSIPLLKEFDPSLEARTLVGDWSAYPYADNVVRVLVQRQRAPLSAGQSAYFINLLYARPEDRARDLTINAVMDGVALVEGEGESVLVGVAPQPRELGSLRIAAALFQLGARTLCAARLTELRSPQGWLVADRPVNVAIEETGQGRIITDGPTVVRFNGVWRVDSGAANPEGNQALQTLRLPAGEYKIALKAPIFSVDEFSVLRASVRPFAVKAAPAPVSFGLKQEWSTELGGDVTVMERLKTGRVPHRWVLGLRDGRVLRLEARGTTQPVGQMGGEVRAIVSFNDEGLLVGDREGTVMALSHGKVSWRHQFDEYWGYRERVVSIAVQPAENEERILVATEAPRIHALDLRGNLQWSTPARGTPEFPSHGRAVEWWGSLTDLQTVDLDSDGRYEIVFATEYKTPVGVLNADGLLRWLTWRWGGSESRSQTPYLGINARALVVTELEAGERKSIIYGTETDEVYVVSPEAKLRWFMNVGGQVNALAVHDLDGDGHQEIMAAAGSGYLTVLDHRGNRLWWREHPGSLTALAVTAVEATNSPVIAVGSTEGHVYVYDQEGHLLATTGVKGAITQLHLQGNGWGGLLTASSQGQVSHWTILPQRRFSRSSRHHY